MSYDLLDEEEKFAKKLLKKHPFIKSMWKEREEAFKIAHKKEAMIEKKYNKMAKKAGLRSLKFAYNEYCFGIDVNDVMGRPMESESYRRIDSREGADVIILKKNN